jgi:hypothetical protein
LLSVAVSTGAAAAVETGRGQHQGRWLPTGAHFIDRGCNKHQQQQGVLKCVLEILQATNQTSAYLCQR